MRFRDVPVDDSLGINGRAGREGLERIGDRVAVGIDGAEVIAVRDGLARRWTFDRQRRIGVRDPAWRVVGTAGEDSGTERLSGAQAEFVDDVDLDAIVTRGGRVPGQHAGNRVDGDVATGGGRIVQRIRQCVTVGVRCDDLVAVGRIEVGGGRGAGIDHRRPVGSGDVDRERLRVASAIAVDDH